MLSADRVDDFPRTFVVKNAALISMDDELPEQVPGAAVLVRDGIIDGVFASSSAMPSDLSDVPSIEAGGRALLPGLTDGHAHLDRETLGDDLPGFAGARSRRDVLDVIAEAVAQRHPGDWVVTRPLGTPPRYPDADRPLSGGWLPDRYDLDSVSRDNPVFIRPIWGFWNMAAKKISFANSLALAAGGITASTVSPHEDLTIVRDERGEPTGMFVETGQQAMVEHTLLRAAPGFSRQQRTAAIGRAFGRYASYGTTAFFEGHGIAGEVLDAYADAYGTPAPLRAHLQLSPFWPEIADLSTTLEGWRDRLDRHAGPFARVDGIFVEATDDPLRYELVASDHPRTGWAGFSAGAVVPAARLEATLLACARAGIRVSGIAANLLDVMARVHRASPIDGLRWTLGHQATLSAQQIDNAAELGLFMTTVTGHHLHRGVYTRALVGTTREKDIVPVRSLMAAGVPVVLGSDNRPISLWESVEHVVTREDDLGNVVAPEQALTRHEALGLITTNGARLTGDTDTRGVLRRGYQADMALLDRNPLDCDARELHATRSVATFVAGRPVSADSSVVRRLGLAPGHRWF
ncbi:amidohydrolase [Georgenia sp. SYP-B2076]|uniref:amidohydrolase n=1 Tax=Georgenia sp. SYP-B2076 TaxID=2495881 RepID=UPI000F8EE926|nr:amidohydrolase family protein [Georgenia sp. SYP-B2076]